jgi:D-aspartate ligase
MPSPIPRTGAPADGLPERAGADWPPAVIAGAFQTGVLGVRMLQRHGVRAVMFDCVPTNPGFQSVYGPARLCPDPDSQPEAWRDFMIGLAREMRARPALIASSDKFVTAIARHAEALAPHYLLSPGVALQGALADKQTQYDLCVRHGMPMPVTRYAHDEDGVRAFAREAMFPCLVKPTHFREWQKFPTDHPLYDTKVAVCETEQELIDNYRLARGVTPDVILQEIILGPDTSKRVYLSVYDGQSRRIANAMFRELRCSPVGFGPASVSEPVDDPMTDEVCDRFLRAAGYSGICEIEMKIDSRDGKVKIIEANPRLSGGGDAAPYAGVELCWIHYLDLIGRTPAPVSPRGNHFKHIVMRADGQTMPIYWRSGLISWRDVLRSYTPPLAFFDLDRRDLRYSLETLFVYLRLLLRELFRRRKPGPTPGFRP